MDDISLIEDSKSAIRKMVPSGCNKELIRLGGEGDGGYLLPNDLKNINACFSPGVSNVTKFENDLAFLYKIPSYMADASVDAESLKLHELHNFQKKFIGSQNDDLTITINSWVLNSNHSDSKDLLLQMDIEGAEYESLLAISSSILEKFKIIMVEFHDLSNLQNGKFLNMKFNPVMDKLLSKFDCVHAHANNCCGVFGLDDYVVPNIIELTFYRKNNNTGKKEIIIPHPLDVLNVPFLDPIYLGKPWVN
jgi:hypothetical protein